MRHSLVPVGVAYLNLPIIYSCYVISLVYGSSMVGSLYCRPLNLGGSLHSIWYFNRLYKGVVFF